MTAKTSEDAGLSIPLRMLCHGASPQMNGTCAEQMAPFFPPFSSTFALVVLVAMIIGIIFVSLATFHFHKRKLRKRKIQRAQEEYERDSRSSARSNKEPVKPRVIVRPPGRDAERSAASRTCVETPSCHTTDTDNLTADGESNSDTALPDEGPEHMLHTVVSS
ncbi:uncharacterized protein C11orf87-like [Lampris incognitus]|uniref:uncharacterized protein C11orf87-like n=1 Tax=Lampris incognitus TaxID=2546036 RepID=UPI0024B63338|nr:uncharacterized protein C11orf87-like [Lampris incognitus]